MLRHISRCAVVACVLVAALPGSLRCQNPTRGQTAEAQRTQEPDVFPDSAYLHLLADLPIVATFSYDVYNQTTLIKVYTEMRKVDVTRCTLSFQVWVQQVQQGAQSRLPRNFWSTAVAIPLNEIDTKALTIRVAHPRRGGRYDPQPWLLRVAMKPAAQPAILVGSVEQSHRRGTRSVDLTMKDYDTAALVKGWLTDGADRCETWNTSPLKPIR